jgi:hypothetical protein
MTSRFSIATTAILLAACQSDRPSDPAPIPAAPPPVQVTHAVPAIPIAPAPADKPKAETVAPDPSTPAGRLAAIKEKYRADMEVYFALFKDAKTDADYEAIEKTAKMPDTVAYRAQARAIVDENPADPVALDAITWMLTQLRGGTDQKELLAIVEKNHMQSDKLIPLARALAGDTKNGGREFVAKLVEKSPSADVRGSALYALASAKLRDIDGARRIQAAKDGDETEKLQKRYEDEYADLKSLDIAAEQKKVDEMLERTVREYPTVVSGKSTLGERAAADLFEAHNLMVGKVAPDIVAEDIDGKQFALADYRGKIVLLDFWGHW